MQTEAHASEMMKDLRKQLARLRVEKAGLKSSLEELEKLRSANEVDEAQYAAIQRGYSEKLTFVEEASNQISRTLQAVRNLEEYEKEKKRLHEEYSSRIRDVEAKIEGERQIAFTMLKHIEDSIKASPERATQTPSSASTIEADPKVEDLRSRIKTEIENIEKVAFSTCVHCGSLLVEGANFCPYCGRKQK